MLTCMYISGVGTGGGEEMVSLLFCISLNKVRGYVIARVYNDNWCPHLKTFSNITVYGVVINKLFNKIV